jgi:hypothetical protein
MKLKFREWDSIEKVMRYPENEKQKISLFQLKVEN